MDVECENKVGGGFKGKEGAMRSAVRRMFAWSHERCCCMYNHSANFMESSYVFAGISNSSKGVHARGEMGI